MQAMNGHANGVSTETRNTINGGHAAIELDTPVIEQDGLSAKELFDSSTNGGLTYNDYILLPGYIDFSSSDVSLETQITRNIRIKTPFMSSPMDTVTEDNMAIAMAVIKYYFIYSFAEYFNSSCLVVLV
jgi:hypothetical protein